MEQVSSILNLQTEKESVLRSRLGEKCPKCGDVIYKEYNICGRARVVKVACKCITSADERKRKIEESKEKQFRLESLMRNSLMDKKFRSSTFENWDFEKGSKTMYDLGKRYVANFKGCREEGLGLLIYGEPGNGKTYLSSCIANELLKQYVPVICVSINGLLSRIQETYNRWGKEAEADVIRGLCNADLLIIDDLGAEIIILD
jgi:DNA replication protein DnaC